MSNYSDQATRPQSPRPQLQTAGERQVSVRNYTAPVTARVNPMRAQIQDARGRGWVGNLDEIVEREKQRLKGEPLPPVPEARGPLPQEPGMLNIIIRQQQGDSPGSGTPARSQTYGCERGGPL